MANKLISNLTSRGTVANSDEIEVQVSGEGLTKKSNVEDVTKIERDARIAQDNVIEASVGLNADGSFPGFSGTISLDSATDVMDALELLDDNLGGEVLKKAVYVDASDVRTLGTIPYEIIPAPGSNYIVQVISCMAMLDNKGTDVECGTQKLVLEYDTGTSHFMEWSNAFIESSSDVTNMGTWTSQAEMIANKKIQLTYDGGADATAGNSTIFINIIYSINAATYAP